MKKTIILLSLVLGAIANSNAQNNVMRYSNVTSIINDRFVGSEPINASFTFNTYSIVLSYGSKSITYEKTSSPYYSEGVKCTDVRTRGINSGRYVEYTIMYDPSERSTAVYNSDANTLLIFQ